LSQDTEKTLEDETDKLVHQIIEQGVDGIIGGFPCQDVSAAGKGAGIQRNAAGEAVTRSGLFWEMAKTVRMVRPVYWLVENVAELLARGMGEVVGEMASCGYDVEWDCVAASTVGAPHHRARTYVLAYDPCLGGERKFPDEIQRQPEFSWCENIRSVEDIRAMPDLPEPLVCRSHAGLARRIHAIGNGNPPCVIREITRGLKCKNA
jgi:DNA (cytosine-5)-methyltransferase 1